MTQNPSFPQPPMSPPPSGQPGITPTPGGERKLSAAALISLILGILGCVPFVTSLLAVILGFVGISKTRDPRYSGRGLAIAGLVLGLVGLLCWTLFGGTAYAIFAGSRPAAQVAHQFTADIAAGNISSAAQRCESSIDEAQLQSLADQFKSWGTFNDLTLPARNVNKAAGESTWTLTGVAQFSNGPKAATFTLRKQADGSYKITGANFK